jgi:hypothetical protein
MRPWQRRRGSAEDLGRYAYSPGLWQVHNASSAHLLDCSLTPAQVRIVSLMTARHWSAAYPWSAQAAMALAAGVDRAVIEAINAGNSRNSRTAPTRWCTPWRVNCWQPGR